MDFALQLDLHNRERQAIEKRIVEEALAAAATQANAPFILAAGEGWHPGVLGIVAGRLKERFGRPAVSNAGSASARDSSVVPARRRCPWRIFSIRAAGPTHGFG